MTFLLDHDVPDDLIYSLRALGHEALTLRSVLEVDTEEPPSSSMRQAMDRS